VSLKFSFCSLFLWMALLLMSVCTGCMASCKTFCVSACVIIHSVCIIVQLTVRTTHAMWGLLLGTPLCLHILANDVSQVPYDSSEIDA